MKRIIWSNCNIEIEDQIDFLQEAYPEIKDESEQLELLYDLNNEYLDDERMNLDIQLSNPILVIADLGLWNGRKSGYKIIKSGNIKDILTAYGDYAEWYSDGYNIFGIDHHHDGTNYYEYREIKNPDNIDTLLNKIYNGKPASRSMLNYYTRSIFPQVANIFGW